MNSWRSVRTRNCLISGTLCVLLAACGAVPTGAPVIERSPNAGARVKAAPAKPVTTAATSSAADAQVVVTGTRPESALPPKTEKPLEPVAVNPLPTTDEAAAAKPYREGDWRPEYHIVRKGDTLYSIALDYGQDYRELAAWNNLADPGLIKIDQRLRLFPPDSVAAGTATPVEPMPLAPVAAKPTYVEPKARKLPYSEQALAQLQAAALKTPAVPGPAAAATQPPSQPAPANQPTPQAVPVPERNEVPAGERKMTWEWPAQGRLLYGFGQGANPKGVGIEGRSGQPVLAAAPGKVVYSGSGLRGYGKLIIIKHNASFLSVYAHNSQILVREGQTVAKGQKIGEIGSTDSDRVALHFEIRRLGKPTDPLQYLPERAS
jgi:lipoprotein NlpD